MAGNFDFSIQKFNLAAGAVRHVALRGTFFYLVEASGPVDVSIDDGAVKTLDVGLGWEAAPGEYFTRLRVINGSPSQNFVRLAVGAGRFIDRRQFGATSPSNKFFGYTIDAAVTDEYQVGQLWNPAGSGVRVTVNRVWLVAAAADEQHLRSGQTAYGEVVATTVTGQIVGGSAVSAAELRRGTGAAIVGAAFASVDALVVGQEIVLLKSPIVILPGNGIHIFEVDVNRSQRVSWEWEESEL